MIRASELAEALRRLRLSNLPEARQAAFRKEALVVEHAGVGGAALADRINAAIAAQLENTKMTNRPPYTLVATFVQGHEHIVAEGHNPSEVREAHVKVSRNRAAIASIVLRDLDGPLDTIWRNTWPD